jgi:hypothetical protein
MAYRVLAADFTGFIGLSPGGGFRRPVAILFLRRSAIFVISAPGTGWNFWFQAGLFPQPMRDKNCRADV